jgi:HAD superfamily phosphatase
MGDAPGKPDPAGLLAVVERLTEQHGLPADLPVIYAGDTVADMQTVVQAQANYAHRRWLGVGILPPHIVAGAASYRDAYRDALKKAGANEVVSGITQLTPDVIHGLER